MLRQARRYDIDSAESYLKALQKKITAEKQPSL